MHQTFALMTADTTVVVPFADAEKAADAAAGGDTMHRVCWGSALRASFLVCRHSTLLMGRYTVYIAQTLCLKIKNINKLMKKFYTPDLYSITII